jgi:rubredoxin
VVRRSIGQHSARRFGDYPDPASEVKAKDCEWADIADDWVCPSRGAAKADFDMVEI